MDRIRFTPPVAEAPRAAAARNAEETLVLDPRAALSPAQMVERRLASVLRGTPLPVSRMASLATRRPLA